MTDTLAESVPEDEEIAVRNIVQASGITIRQSLALSGCGERVFMVVSAPSGRDGKIAMCTDLHGSELTRFLRHVLEHVQSNAFIRVEPELPETTQ